VRSRAIAAKVPWLYTDRPLTWTRAPITTIDNAAYLNTLRTAAGRSSAWTGIRREVGVLGATHQCAFLVGSAYDVGLTGRACRKRRGCEPDPGAAQALAAKQLSVSATRGRTRWFTSVSMDSRTSFTRALTCPPPAQRLDRTRRRHRRHCWPGHHRRRHGSGPSHPSGPPLHHARSLAPNVTVLAERSGKGEP
jgi:hypothetical protein